MRAKIFAILREWNILIGFCLILGGDGYIAFVSSMSSELAAVAPTAASSQPPASQVASKDSASAAPQSSPAARAPVDLATPGQTPAASGPAAHQMPGHGLAQPPSAPATSVIPTNAPPAQPVAPSASASSTPAPVVVAANAPPAQPVTPTTPNIDPRDGCRRMRRQAAKSTENAKPATRWRPARTQLARASRASSARSPAEAPNYNYSAAMKSANLVWDAATLDAYLLDPQKLVPQNKMPFPGLKTANERKDVIAYLAAATSPAGPPAVAQRAQPPAAAPAQPSAPDVQRAPAYLPETRYTLRTGIAEGRMVYLGVGGTIDGQVNPILSAAEGQTVQIILINGEGAEHDIVFPEQDAKSSRIFGRGASTSIAFHAKRAGYFTYLCSVPGHELAGMRGQLIVTPRPPEQVVVEADISQKSTEVPPPIGNRPPQMVRVDLEGG